MVSTFSSVRDKNYLRRGLFNVGGLYKKQKEYELEMEYFNKVPTHMTLGEEIPEVQPCTIT